MLQELTSKVHELVQPMFMYIVHVYNHFNVVRSVRKLQPEMILILILPCLDILMCIGEWGGAIQVEAPHFVHVCVHLLSA